MAEQPPQEPKVWHDGAEDFMALDHLSQDRALHPALVELIEAQPGLNLLDYGCGDGRVLTRLSSRWIIDAYDPSEPMRRLAMARVGSRIRSMLPNTESLEGVYDVIILGMVIMCIPEAAEVRRVLADCARLLAPGGQLFVTTTHPCFRNHHFSNFHTSFTGDLPVQPFLYRKDGLPFEVAIHDPDGRAIVFTDYHWSLEFTFEALRGAGLGVSRFREVSDDPSSPSRNNLVPPYLILQCERLS